MTTPKQYQAFRAEANKLAGIMVNEFNRRKKTLELQNVQYSKTGSIDRRRVKYYQSSDDIFKRKAYKPDGKNYSFHTLIDWSGSMSSIIAEVIEQVIIQSIFCRKVGLKFEVFSFTDITSDYFHDKSEHCSIDYHAGYSTGGAKDWTADSFRDAAKIVPNGALYKFLSDAQSNSKFERACYMLWTLAGLVGNRQTLVASSDDNARKIYRTLAKFQLTGTPLNSALVQARVHLKKYKAKYNIDQQNLIVLSDGVSRHVENGARTSSHAGLTVKVNNRIMIDSATNKQYKLADGFVNPHYSQTQLILNSIEGVHKTCYYLQQFVYANSPTGSQSKRWVQQALRDFMLPVNYGGYKYRERLENFRKSLCKMFSKSKYTSFHLNDFAGYDKFVAIPVHRLTGTKGADDTEIKTAKQLMKSMDTDVVAFNRKRNIVIDFVKDFTDVALKN